jgi:hypothetical protein
LALAGVVVDGYAIRERQRVDQRFANEVVLGRTEAQRIRAQVILPKVHTVSAGLNFAAALIKFGLRGREAAEATAAAQSAFNLRQFRAGNTIPVGRSVLRELREINYKIDPECMLRIVPERRGLSAQITEIPSQIAVETVSGRVEDSLFSAVEDAGESPEVALRMPQMFGYDLDFYTDPRKGDTFHITAPSSVPGLAGRTTTAGANEAERWH